MTIHVPSQYLGLSGTTTEKYTKCPSVRDYNCALKIDNYPRGLRSFCSSMKFGVPRPVTFLKKMQREKCSNSEVRLEYSLGPILY